MGIFSKKKTEPVEVEATVKKKSTKTKTDTKEEQPKMVVQLSGSEMHLAYMIEELGKEVHALREELGELTQTIKDNL